MAGRNRARFRFTSGNNSRPILESLEQRLLLDATITIDMAGAAATSWAPGADEHNCAASKWADEGGVLLGDWYDDSKPTYTFLLPAPQLTPGNVELTDITVYLYGERSTLDNTQIFVNGNHIGYPSGGEDWTIFSYSDSDARNLLLDAGDGVGYKLDITLDATDNWDNYDLKRVVVEYDYSGLETEWLANFHEAYGGYRALMSYKAEVVGQLWDATEFGANSFHLGCQQTISFAQNLLKVDTATSLYSAVNAAADALKDIQDLMNNVANAFDWAEFWTVYSGPGPDAVGDYIDDAATELRELSNFWLSSIGDGIIGDADVTSINNGVNDAVADLIALKTKIRDAASEMFFWYTSAYDGPGSGQGDVTAGTMLESLRPLMHYTYYWTPPTGGMTQQGDSYLLKLIEAVDAQHLDENDAPIISGLPDRTLDEDSSLNNTIDLWAYASDNETPDSGLTFSIVGNTNPNCGVSIDSRYIDINPVSDWYGISDVTVEVSDGSLTDTDTFRVTVNSVNDAPTAHIDNITPNPAEPPGDVVAFNGTGSDTDGTVVQWEWTSDIDGLLSTAEDFTYSSNNLTIGEHQISFKVRDNEGAWSDPDTAALTINILPTATIGGIPLDPVPQGITVTLNLGGYDNDENGQSIVAGELYLNGTLIDTPLPGAYGLITPYSASAHVVEYRVQDDEGFWSPLVLGGTLTVNPGGPFFASSVDYTAGDYPVSVALGDLNGDGNLDMAVANQDSNNVSVLLSNGDGTFAGRVNYGAGDGPHSVALGDLDGDGDADMAVANYLSDNVSVLFNNGDGTFAARVDYGAGDEPHSVALGDLDGDGDADMAVANRSSDNVSVLLNNGDGTFAAPVDYGAGDEPRSVALGDLDGNGDLDMAVANYYSDNVSVLLNNGDGTFAARVDYGAGDGPISVVLGDVDGDGHADMAVANLDSENVSVLFNNGDGTFAARVDYGVGNSPRSVALGDLDGDGHPDMAMAGFSKNNISVLLNNGDGTFAARVDYGAGVVWSPRSVALGDLDGDGDADMAVTHSDSDNVSVLLNNGDGTFAARVNYGVGNSPWSVALGDLDGDGDTDMATANWGSDNVSVLLNNGDGTFAARVDYGAGDGPWSVALGDLDGDGDLDMAVAKFSSDNVSVLLNNGDGTFAARVDYGVGGWPNIVALGDLDGDGDLDMAVANQCGNVSVLLNNGDGTFAARVDYGAGVGPLSVALGDLDGNGDLDMAVANWGSDNVSVLLNNGDGTFAGRVDYGAGDGPFSVALGDLDGDGDPDMAVANRDSHNVSVLLNNGDGTFAAPLDYGAGDAPQFVALGDLDGDGDSDMAVANRDSHNISVLFNNGDGTFAARVDYGTGSWPTSVALGDLNGDGDLDMAVANGGSDNVSVWLNQTVSESVNGGLEQRSMVTSIEIKFGEDMSIEASDIFIDGLVYDNDVTSDYIHVDYNPSTYVATLTFDTNGDATFGDSLLDDRYDLVLNCAGITDTAGNPLAEMDGTPDGQHTYSFHRFFGDSDGDADVDASDLFKFRQTFGKVSPDPAYNWAFDHDQDGDVDASNLFKFRQNFGQVLAPAATGMGAAFADDDSVVSALEDASPLQPDNVQSSIQNPIEDTNPRVRARNKRQARLLKHSINAQSAPTVDILRGTDASAFLPSKEIALTSARMFAREQRVSSGRGISEILRGDTPHDRLLQSQPDLFGHNRRRRIHK